MPHSIYLLLSKVELSSPVLLTPVYTFLFGEPHYRWFEFYTLGYWNENLRSRINLFTTFFFIMRYWPCGPTHMSGALDCRRGDMLRYCLGRSL